MLNTDDSSELIEVFKDANIDPDMLLGVSRERTRKRRSAMCVASFAYHNNSNSLILLWIRLHLGTTHSYLRAFSMNFTSNTSMFLAFLLWLVLNTFAVEIGVWSSMICIQKWRNGAILPLFECQVEVLPVRRRDTRKDRSPFPILHALDGMRKRCVDGPC